MQSIDRNMEDGAICRYKQVKSGYVCRELWSRCSIDHVQTSREMALGPKCKSDVRTRLQPEQYKKAQLSLTNPRDTKACQKLLQFDVLTTLSLTILVYLHSFSCCSRSSILVSIERAYATSY